jgi:hypothetical protein
MPADHMSALQQISMMVSVFTDAGIARDVVEESWRDPPDAVILDCLLLSAIDAAARAGLRTVVLVHSFYAFSTARSGGRPLRPCSQPGASDRDA